MQRKGITIITFIILLLTYQTQAAPDPDIFDGRTDESQKGSAFGESQSGQQSKGVETASAGGTSSGTANPTPESTTKPGQAVSTNGSKTDKPKGGKQQQEDTDAANSPSGEVDKGDPNGNSTENSPSGGNANLGTDINGSASQKGAHPSGHSTTSQEAGAERNFEAFGFGGGLGTVIKEVAENSSKVSSTSESINSAENQPKNPEAKLGSGGQKGSKPAQSNSKGDYGTNLPSGI
ncbi:MAG: hypothetical protein ACON39_08225 [Coraliomargaritaceae bacterium]